MEKEKSVAIYGCGNFGLDLLKGLSQRGVKLYKNSYGSSNINPTPLDFNGQLVDILSVNDLWGSSIGELREEVSCLIVTLTGNILEKEIDFILSFNIPLIICSTKYDKNLIINKAKKEGVTILTSYNMALPIVDFWNRIESLEDKPETIGSRIYIKESHQSTKIDVSGSAIEELSLFIEKGFLGNLPDDLNYEFGDFYYSGSIVSIRKRKESFKLGVPKTFINNHGYHTIFIRFDIDELDKPVNKEYYEYFYNHFKSLENYSIPGIINFEVNYVEQGIEIIHNINGRDIYSEGVKKAIEFLKNNEGIYTEKDLLG